MNEKKVRSERKRLDALLERAEVPKKKREALEVVLENMAVQRVALAEAAELIKASPCVIPYDNGGGQAGMRQNPAYKAYQDLWKAYLAGLQQFADALPDDLQEEAAEGSNPLASVLQMKDKKKA